MKNIKTILIGSIFTILVCFTACDDGLAEININPNTSDVLTYNAQFLRIETHASGPRYVAGPMLSFAGGMVQHAASLSVSGFPGDKYWDAGGNAGEHYNYRYTNTVKNLVDLVNRTSEDPDLSNYHNIARIMKVFVFQRITDLYGDVPYSEAGLGFEDGNITPVFDTQESIYMDLLKELSEAIPALSDAKLTYDASDQIYSGSISKWRKMGYSLMLRVAMRLQKVNPTLAAQYASTAVNGGVFEDNSDNMVMINSSGDESNWNGFNRYMVDNFNGHRISKTLVDVLVNTGDPRLPIYAQSYDDVSPIMGLPNGYDPTTILDTPGGDDLDKYAWWNKDIITPLDAPRILMTYSEICLMQAEAVLRGWIAGDATDWYNKGVAAGMTQWDVYNVEVPDMAAIDTYLVDNPFDSSYKMIGEQYWLTTYMNFYESFANFRRTGFPELVPVNYPGNETGGTIPRRLPYSVNESQLNAENYNAAVSRQGPDTYTTRMWWDVP